jgi:predicted NBD/HSP70 family sugar kinase
MKQIQSGRPQGADPRLVREINRHTVFSILKQNREISVSQISHLTGLSLATIKAVLEDLRRYDLIRELGEGVSAGGRKPKMYSLNLVDVHICGMEMHSHSLKICVLKLDGTIVLRKNWSIKGMNPVDVADFIQQKLLHTIAEARINDRKMLGAGLSQPGIVDFDGKNIRFDVHSGWNEIPFGSMLQERIPFPVFLVEEANAKMIAEIEFGNAGNYKDFIYVMIGSSHEGGISGGIVLNGEIVLGSQGFAGELGHMSLNYLGPRCFCGRNGCWEALSGIPEMLESVQQICPWANVQSIEELFVFLRDAFHQGITECSEMLNNFISVQADGIANLIHIFNPSHIVIGGTAALMGDVFLEKLLDLISAKTMKPFLENTKIELSSIERDSAVLGAGSRVLQDALTIKQKTLV